MTDCSDIAHYFYPPNHNIMPLHSLRRSLSTPIPLELWLFLLLCAFASLADVMEFQLHQPYPILTLSGLTCLAVFKATALSWAYVVSKGNGLLKYLIIGFIAVFAFLSLLNGFCWVFYDFGITRKLFLIFFETNGNEVTEFLPELRDKFFALFHSYGFYLIVIIYILLARFLPKIPFKTFNVATIAFSIVGFAYLVFVMATADFGKSNHLAYMRTLHCANAVRQSVATIREMQNHQRLMPEITDAESNHLAKEITVVIGESASRDHLSAYGYPLATSPRLDTIPSGLYLFTDAVASSSSTAENIPRLLTFMTDEPTEKEWFDYPTLLGLFKKLGYKTAWLSNQEKTGEFSNLSGILSSDADIVNYLGSYDSEDNYLMRHDEILLPDWTKLIHSSDSLQLNFLHLYGSHFQYHKRFPASRRKIQAADVAQALPRKWLNSSKAEIIADYDNSILYTDSILSVVIEETRQLGHPALMIYLSDHGENVYDDRDFRGRDPKFVRVPFLIYANKAYREHNPEIIENIEVALRRPFSTSELSQILLHLTGTTTNVYDSIRDPLSPTFRVRIRYVDDQPFCEDQIPQ